MATDELTETLQHILTDAVERGVFSGAQAGLLVDNGRARLWSVGHTAWPDAVPDGHTRVAITNHTRFDLASLTKAVVTAPLVWYAVGQGALRLDDPARRWLPDWRGGGGVTVCHLLTHTSGLPAWLPLYEEGSPEAIWERLMGLELEQAPGTRAVYSDMGFLLLGRLLERCLGAPLDALARQIVLGPLEMDATRFVRHVAGEALERAGGVAATEATAVAAHQGAALCGEVHDENAWALGGVAAHAGLFGTASDLLRWGRAVLGADQAPGAAWPIPSSVVRWALSSLGGVRGEDGALLGSHLGGLDTPSGERSTAGPVVAREPAGVTVGHLGFTGTSLWIDRSRRLVMTLLTNRVHPSREAEGIREVRVALHEAAVRLAAPTASWSIAPPAPVLGGSRRGPAVLLPARGRRELEVAIQVAREAGSVARMWATREQSSLKVEHKGEVDLVTRADLEAERTIAGLLKEAFPEDGLLAEEGGGSLDAERQWIVDPIDGTTNFSHRLPHFSVSVALRVAGQLQVGVVYDPMRDELFYASRGGGAWLNGRPLRASGCRELVKALVVTGFPYDRHTAEDNNFDRFEAMARRCQGVRRNGSAALDLAYVAAGRFDLYWEGRLNPWDLAAGVLLVEEAGGRVTRMDGGPFELEGGSLLVSGGALHDPALAVLRPLIRR